MYKVNDIVNGFKLISIQNPKDAQETAYIFSHLVTKSTLVFIDDKSDKRCFHLGVRTPAKDDTGVSHVIEHCVLEGSKKYTPNEAFLHRQKYSLCDEANAYTLNESTRFHFTSQNEKDFDIVFDFYMDGILNPRFLEDKNIFLREGWHYEVTKDNKLAVNGIVFNEMKMSMLDKWNVEWTEVLTKTLPGSSFEFEAGGDVCVIPTLKYEYAKEYYSRYYHPSNMVLVLSGKLNIENISKF